MGYHLKSFTELVADGAWADVGMYIGAGSSMPGWYTFIGVVACVVILAMGNKSEHDHYDKHQ
ncbi:MAG TPA: hypothetical protein DCX64_02240 [Gammaproteobacteria bacterium]|jgi:hypothetical protein|nr:hypothetical protein [Gammaproteobacteria bacterium]|tara:strand:- start:2185 stop:2370 length:186 start_codon:yes stop_codon:yes gene_type:complete